MVKDLAAAQMKFAANLREIAAKHAPYREGDPTTGGKQFHSVLAGVTTCASVHQQFGDVLESNVQETLKGIQLKSLDVRKGIVEDAKVLSVGLHKELDALEKVRSKWDKAEAKALKAKEEKKIAEQTGKGNVEKLHRKWVDLAQAADGAEKDLKGETDRVNDCRTIFYHNTMRATLDQMEAADQQVAVQVRSHNLPN
jgi:citrate lyase gamma subunit